MSNPSVSYRGRKHRNRDRDLDALLFRLSPISPPKSRVKKLMKIDLKIGIYLVLIIIDLIGIAIAIMILTQ